VDAKSPVKVMRVRVPQGALLHIRADAKAAADALVALVESEFVKYQAEGLSQPADD
jgi:phosphocarrier protein